MTRFASLGDRIGWSKSLALGFAVAAQLAAAAPVTSSRAANDLLMREALASSVADEPSNRPMTPAMAMQRYGNATAVKPITAWRAAYIARHGHEPPVKGK